MARPAAEVTACCSAMPTSKVRSGNRAWKVCRPTGCIIAAVRATMSLRSAPSATISSENESVQIRPFDGPSPVSGSNGPTWWNWSASCRSAAS